MKNLDTTLSLFLEKVLVSLDDFIWKVVGSDERNIPIKEVCWNGVVVDVNIVGVGVG
jgi:hypothetical protein